MKEFLIRCSAIGKIMAGNVGLSEPQKKKVQTLQDKMKAGKDLTILQTEEYHKLLDIKDNPQLSAGAKTYCQMWLKEQLYERRKEFSSKYTDKGNAVEDESIRYLNKCLGKDYAKNEDYYQNNYLCGTPDIVGDNHIIDVKNNWDFSTFPLFDTGIQKKDYYYQLQGYMALTFSKTATLAYLLMDAPHHLIEREARQLAYRDNLDYDWIFEDVQKQMSYSNIENKALRLKCFPVDYCPSVIAEIEERVKMCRKYIEEIKDEIK